MRMLDWFTNIVALVMNPLTLLLFLVVMRHVKKIQKKGDNPLWTSHQGRGA
jgi:hypothetical protein